MRAIAMLLAATRAHFSAKAPASTAQPLNPPAECTTSPIASSRLKTPQKHVIMKTFVRSPLAATSLTVTEVDALDTVFSDAVVQRAAGQLQLQLRRARLLELAGFRSAISEATLAAGEPARVTPEQVVAILTRLSDDVEDELAALREDRAQHDACHKARMARIQPLRVAVSLRLTALIGERERCVLNVDAIRRASTMSSPSAHRYHSLIAAGITPTEISMLSIEDPEDQVVAAKARVVVIDAELAPLRAFGASGDVAHLAGLGLDDLIALAYPSRVGEEAAA